MKAKNSLVILISMMLISCKTSRSNRSSNPAIMPIAGTWQLISGTLIENGDTTVTDYRKSGSFIKIINKTHFAFLQHDLHKGKDSAAVFVAGGGRYSLAGNLYTEHLEYCSDREWEGNDFTFTIAVNGDTLIQKGTEKVENKGINRLNIERYIKVR